MSKRDSLFLSGSVGRTGVPVQRTASFESLSAHPLLSPPIPSPSGSSTDSHSPTQTPATRYVPYTPRQRGAPIAATTGTTMHPSVTVSATPHAHPSQGDAASKLQLMNLKAAAQRAGLDAASAGWAILERLASETDHGAEWNELWSALSAVLQATLLLPTEPQPTGEPLTAAFVKDHIALCDASAASRTTSIITLSGLRGTLANNTLTFRSTLSPSSKAFQALLMPATRASALAALPPLPRTLTGSHSHSYPTFSVPTHTPALPLPPRPSVSTAPKGPPLPPRPSARPVTHSPQPHPAARLSNPFASLFGRATSSPTPPASPTAGAVPLHAELAAQPTSSTPPDASTAEPPSPATVPAYTIGARIQRGRVLGSLARAVRAELDQVLAAGDVPAWMRERVEEWASWVGPAVPAVPARGGAAANGDARRKVSGAHSGAKDAWEVAGELGGAETGGIEDVARRFQEFYDELAEEVLRHFGERESGRRRTWGRARGHRKDDSLSPSGSGSGEEGEKEKEKDGEVEAEDEKEKEASEREKEGEEERKEEYVRAVMETIERALCSLYYDRLFLPPSSDDASHDEALSSRIAAVNLLDLGLGHLGVDVGASGEEVNALITACGQTLMQLDSVCRAPADKAAVLVSVHKILVDGLSKLPPLTLKSEDEILDEKTPRAASFGRYSAEEEEDSNAEAQTSSPAPINTELPERDAPPPPAVVLSPEEETSSALLGMEPSASTSTVTPRSVADASASATPESTRTSSPLLTVSAPDGSPTPVSGDIILPLMIFAVVKANPPHLVSHLLFTQRFRRERAAGGEEGYCLINLMAVAEFLENVDLAALGLGESEKMVISTAELTPIPLARSALGTEPTSPRSVHSTIRGRVEQQVDAIAGSANKVISGVVDTSFGVLRALLPGQTAPSDGHPDASATSGNGEVQEAAPRPGFGLLRRDTGFSIASLAASLPGASGRLKPAGQGEEAGQQMVEVPSRPGSVRSVRGVEDSTSEDEEGSSEDEDYEEEEEEHDTRSIRSFESMMSSRSRQRRKRKVTNGRKSITDRLASMPGLSRLSQSGQHEATKGSPPGSRRSSLLLPPAVPGVLTRYESPTSSRAASPIAIRISPPNPRFLTCSEDDIKVSEVGELLREYKRLAEAVRAMGGFHE